MKLRSFVIALAVLGAMLTAPAVQAVPLTPFTGAWTSTDLDGSTQYATISGGAVLQVTYTDLGGAVCVANGAPTHVFSSTITGTVTGNTFAGTFTSARCGSLRFDSLVGTAVTLHYETASDTLFDGSVTWYRR
jgi:hypothetical protein